MVAIEAAETLARLSLAVHEPAGTVIAEGQDNTSRHPLQHAVMVAIEAAAARDRRLWPAKAPAACANQTQPGMCANQTQPGMCANQTQPGGCANETQPASSANQTQPGVCANETQPGMCANQTQPGMCANQTQPELALEVTGLEQVAPGAGPQHETDSQSTAEAQDVLQGKFALCTAWV